MNNSRQNHLVKVVRIRLLEEDGTEKSRLVTLWAGSEINEIREVISASFGVSWKNNQASTPVALVAQRTGLVVPLSVACKYPHTLDDEVYSLLRLDGQGANDYDQFQERGNTQNSDISTVPSEDVEEEAKVEKLTVVISKFARLLESTGRITSEEAVTAMTLASKRDPVVLAAYAVAATEQNAEQLAFLLIKVCRDYMVKNNADDPNSFDGPTEHAVAEQLLRVIDELYINPKYDLNLERCRYLQRLVLTKEPVVFAALDVFAEDNDLEELFDTLLRVASRGSTASIISSTQKPEIAAAPSTSASIQENIPAAIEAEQVIAARRAAVFQECIAWLVEKEVIQANEGKALLDAVQNENPSLCQAFASYTESSDLETFLEALTKLSRTMNESNSSQMKSQAATAVTKNEETELLDDASISVLAECVAWLREKNILEAVHAAALIAAAKVNDPRLRDALQLYAESKDLGRLLESLSILARVLVDDAGAILLAQDKVKRPATADASGEKEARAIETKNTSVQQEQEDNNDDDAFWDENDDSTRVDPPPSETESNLEGQATRQLETQNSLIESSKGDESRVVRMLSELVTSLVKEERLSDLEYDAIMRLLKEGDARLMAAYDVYEDSKDIDDFSDTVFRLAKLSISLNDDEKSSGHKEVYDNDESDEAQLEAAVRPLPDDSGREGLGSDLDDLNKDKNHSTSKKSQTVKESRTSISYEQKSNLDLEDSRESSSEAFQRLLHSSLSAVEIAAVELSASRKDPELNDAILRYHNDPNDTTLLSDLKRIADSTIKETVSK